MKRFKEYVKSKFNRLADWVTKHAPPMPKIVDDVWNFVKNSVQQLRGKKSPEPEPEPRVEKETFKHMEKWSALNGFTTQYIIEANDNVLYDPDSFLDDVKETVIGFLKNNRQTKVRLKLCCMMDKPDIKSGEIKSYEAPFYSGDNEINLESVNLDELYTTMKEGIKENMTKFQREGSNWTFSSIINLSIYTDKYRPLRGATYIKLPEKLRVKRAIINMKNRNGALVDDQCFKWSVVRAVDILRNKHCEHPERVDKNLQSEAKKYNWSFINFPAGWDDIDIFERFNKSITVNVLGYNDEEDTVYPLRISKNVYKDGTETVVLLLIKNEDGQQHYCVVKNLSRLLYSQATEHHGERFYCLRCLNGFNCEDSRKKHLQICSQKEAVRRCLPQPKEKEGEFQKPLLFFCDKKLQRSSRVPFTFYADFEALTAKIDTCQPKPLKSSYTLPYQKHVPVSFSFHLQCSDEIAQYVRENNITIPQHCSQTFVASTEYEDVAQKFVDSIEKAVVEIYNLFLKDERPIIITEEVEQKFNIATRCHICGKGGFSKDSKNEYSKVKDHCHITGRFRGAAHKKCNRFYQTPKFITIVFHNLSNYDCHLFIQKLGGEIKCIPNNEERYISFSKILKFDDGKSFEMRFIDSFRFMSSSLDDLVKNLNKDQLKNLKEFFPVESEFNLVMRKGIFPYDYLDSVTKLAETSLPPEDEFYSRLKDEGVRDGDYKHAKKVWKEFNTKTFREYLELYNKVDVLLLADVFENFRDLCMKHYGLDPAWYYTAPGLSWDAALKTTGVKLELLSDINMLFMVQKGIRGGTCMAVKRFAQANNKYMGDSYDSSKPSSFIIYLDENNLYGWSMSQELPTHGFEWMNDEELENWKNTPCILEVDLEYSDEFHDLHNDFPLAPEQVNVNKVNKLIPNLNGKKSYVIYYKNLMQYEKLGLRIAKIHRGIKFEESRWLKKYIDKNTKLRRKATNECEKDLFKLMNNIVFGKTIENVENRVDISLITSEEKAKRKATQPNYDRSTIFNENLIAVHMKRTNIYYNKPIYLGMIILDISKKLMNDFHYNYIKKKYPNEADLIYTDTDSLMYHIKTNDFYADISNDVNKWFDTSELPVDHPSGIPVGVNKKVPGMMKDETKGKIIKEVVVLRAKLYSYVMYEEGKETKKCKGITKAVIKNAIFHKDYKDCLFSEEKQYRKMNIIRSRKHEVYSEEINKVALSADDDKRHVL